MSYKEYKFDSTTEWQDDDVDCTITFEYTPPSKMTNDCPDYGGEVEITSIMIDGKTTNHPAIDICDLIGSKQTERLDVACFEFVEEQMKSDLEDCGDYKYSMMKDERDYC